ncbi:MAG: Cyclohexanone monooxygenase, partial [uncultured Solirubrobacteraceae bacterium]
AASGRDHRCRVQRDRHRDQAPRGRRARHRAVRPRRPRRRHVAGEHVSGRGLRHPVAPVLVLLRAATGLVASVPAAARGARVPRGVRPHVRPGGAPAPRHRGRRRDVRRGARDVDARARFRRADARVRRARRRHGPAQPPGVSAAARHRRVRGRRVPLRALAPRPRPARARRRRHRDRRERDPVRPRDRTRGAAADGLPAQRALRDPEGRSRVRTRPPQALREHAAAAPGAPRLLRVLRGRHARVHRNAPARDPAAQRLPSGAAALAGPRPGDAREAHARLRHWLQARAREQRLVSRAPAPERRGRHRPHPLDRRRRRRHRRRRAPPRRHDHLRHGLRGERLPRADGDPRSRRARAQRRLARGGRGVPRHDRRRLPEPLHPLRAEHEPRERLDHLHARVADPVRRGRRAPSRAGGRRVPRRQTRRAGALQPRDLRAHAADGVADRLHVVVRHAVRAQHEQLARPHARVPPPDAEDRPGRLPPRAGAL